MIHRQFPKTWTFHNTVAVHSSPKALLIYFKDDKGNVEGDRWIPLLQIDERSQVKLVGDEGDLIISFWLAEKLRDESTKNTAVATVGPDKVYKALTRKYHPDLNPNGGEVMTDINELNQAWKQYVENTFKIKL